MIPLAHRITVAEELADLLRDTNQPAAHGILLGFIAGLRRGGESLPESTWRAPLPAIALTATASLAEDDEAPPATPPGAAEPEPRPRHRPLGSSRLFPPEREALLRDIWTQRITVADILAQLNALPGPPLKERQVYTRARDLRLPARPHVVDPAKLARISEQMKDLHNRFSPERDDVLRAGWAAGKTAAEILQDVNALPGREVTSLGAIYKRRERLNLPDRDHSAVQAERMRALRAEQDRVWSPDRQAAMRARFAAGDDDAALLLAVNALPGVPVRSVHAVKAQRLILGLLRPSHPPPRAAAPPPAAQSEPCAPGPAAEVAPEPPAPAAAAIAPAAPAAAAPPVYDQQEEARRLLRHGYPDNAIINATNIGAAALAELRAEAAAVADDALAKQMDRARRLLAEGVEAWQVRAQTRLPLREVMRLEAEQRQAKRARALQGEAA